MAGRKKAEDKELMAAAEEVTKVAAEITKAPREFKYEVVEKIGVLSEGSKGWTKEFRRISWNGGKPKYDIRDWAPEDSKMGKGVTLSEEEVLILKELLDQINL